MKNITNAATMLNALHRGRPIAAADTTAAAPPAMGYADVAHNSDGCMWKADSKSPTPGAVRWPATTYHT